MQTPELNCLGLWRILPKWIWIPDWCKLINRNTGQFLVATANSGRLRRQNTGALASNVSQYTANKVREYGQGITLQIFWQTACGTLAMHDHDPYIGRHAHAGDNVASAGFNFNNLCNMATFSVFGQASRRRACLTRKKVATFWLRPALPVVWWVQLRNCLYRQLRSFIQPQ